jgi:hypothetical protein
MTLPDLQEICSRITFCDGVDHDWTLRCGDDATSLWLQWVFVAEDNECGGVGIQHGRKWRISYHSTSDEIVKTAFAAALFAIEHEARERFTYKGEAIFHPHMDVEALVELASERRHIKRDEVVA